MAHSESHPKRINNTEKESYLYPVSGLYKTGILGFPYAFAVLENGVFSLQKSEYVWSRPGLEEKVVPQFISSGLIYYPIHPHMTRQDIEGATHAFDVDGKWMFAHCSPEEQISLAAEVRTFTEHQLANKILQVNAATHRVRAHDMSRAAGRKAETLAIFAERAGQKAYDAVLAESLGHFHRNPHNDHKRELAKNALSALLEDWRKLAQVKGATKENKANYDDVRATVATIIARLATTHTIKTWHEARLASPVFPGAKTGAHQTWTAGTAIDPITVPEVEGYPASVYSAPFLPTGIAFDADTRVLSGTPATSGGGTITIKAKNSQGEDSWTMTYTITAAQGD